MYQGKIDLRSDTVTRPSPGMRKAIAEAIVGDDVLRDDPTVKRLEEMTASMLGKEAAMFVASGVMANQVSMLYYATPGCEVIIQRDSHVVTHEAAAAPFISGVQYNLLQGSKGALTVHEVKQGIRPAHITMPQTRLIWLEDTHNAAGGTVFVRHWLKEIAEIAQEHGLPIHCDGARIFNSAIAAGNDIKEHVKYYDSVSFCLSKGLGAPVGAMVAGSADYINKTRRFRRMLGGAMRQAGILAAAGIYALQNNINLLADDHRRARRLAEAIHSMPAFEIDMESVQTNIVRFRLIKPGKTAKDLVEFLAKNDILAFATGIDSMRMVTHMDISDSDIDKTIEVLGSFR